MKKPTHPPRRRHLTKEDEAFWEHTASSLEPLKVKKQRHLADAVFDPDAFELFEPKGKAAKKSHAEPHTAGAKHAATSASPPAPSRSPPELMTFDRKSARRLRQGQIEIEARIDLHGMRQNEAHVALRHFLMSAYRRGLRWVLVITGKGGPRAQRDDDIFGSSERGVLRRNVPMWLGEPELRAVVVSFTTAAIPHGGEGAIYVQLRNPDRVR
ncbi:MAG: Smr/MutS family protein [Hyphomicrobium zavarzinii]|jgi:DNA-nicking Smr family endonuclease|uniref:Smr/MutS family protein n=1 Tax=Hyphomicrobium TaxID=81 RepID=UPI0003614C74|nr:MULTISPECIES: Smr/MutS family protein [Hyphomicrobium]MBL8844983.1 Smr/MutS family protein [Hyphomicrobium zavarzinii]WBT38609.1 Smr/MutS family protein [Hyphomicrobium sp. DMF-1]HML44044.1 Smr/MutS family protein [Hyphomicrobium zavarzinii]